MRIIFFTDPHGRGNNPISRKDDFPQTVLKKMRWVIDTANELEAYVVCGGDWLNRPDTSPSFIAEVGKILKDLKSGPVFSIVGNHDIYGYNPETFARTPLHILEALDVIRLVSKETPTYFKRGEVCLTGTSATHDIDKEDKKAYFIEPEKEGFLNIHVVHGFLTDHAWPHVDCTLIDEIIDTKADIILTGHEHSGFGIVKKNGKIFCNPGALLRVSGGVGDVNMTVRVALIDTEADDIVSFINLPDTIALPAMEVIDRDKLVREKEHNKKMQQFFESVSCVDLSMMDDRDIFTIFNAFAEIEKLEDNVRGEVMKRLSLAQEKEKR